MGPAAPWLLSTTPSQPLASRVPGTWHLSSPGFPHPSGAGHKVIRGGGQLCHALPRVQLGQRKEGE